MADKTWNLFLQKLRENDSSLADIAESTETVLLGIVEDFGFSNLQKGQILTRFKSEGTFTYFYLVFLILFFLFI